MCARYRNLNNSITKDSLPVVLFLCTALVLSLAIASSVHAENRGNTKFQSFNKAKKILLQEIYYDHQKTCYCDCAFTDKNEILHNNGYVPKKKWKRAYRLEWEHIVPAHAFGQSFSEWREGHPECISSKGIPFKGRNCARKMAIPFRYMEADMYNLVPAVGEINALRSNYSFGMIPGEKREFGNCDMEIQERKVEPPPAIRGDIARTYFYMDWAYPGRGIISRKNQKLFQAWNREDPVDEWECERCQRIEHIQGNENPFVRIPCQSSRLW